jgi:hypothetical protein
MNESQRQTDRQTVRGAGGETDNVRSDRQRKRGERKNYAIHTQLTLLSNI